MLFLYALDSLEDKNKFEKLYEKYFNFLFSVAKKKLFSYEDIEDVVQDVFLYVAKNFDKIGDVESKETRNFLATIANGFAINKYNKEIKREHLSTDDENFISDIAEYEITDKDLSDIDKFELSTIIDMLDEDNRNYIYLTYIYGYSSKEIAKMYNVSDSFVRKRIQISKKQLKTLLREAA